MDTRKLKKSTSTRNINTKVLSTNNIDVNSIFKKEVDNRQITKTSISTDHRKIRVTPE